jgi:hypothetical protein
MSRGRRATALPKLVQPPAPCDRAGKDARQAAATRDAAVVAVNRGGACSLQVEGGVTGLCEYAAVSRGHKAGLSWSGVC